MTNVSGWIVIKVNFTERLTQCLPYQFTPLGVRELTGGGGVIGHENASYCPYFVLDLSVDNDGASIAGNQPRNTSVKGRRKVIGRLNASQLFQNLSDVLPQLCHSAPAARCSTPCTAGSSPSMAAPARRPRSPR